MNEVTKENVTEVKLNGVTVTPAAPAEVKIVQDEKTVGTEGAPKAATADVNNYKH